MGTRSRRANLVMKRGLLNGVGLGVAAFFALIGLVTVADALIRGW